MGLLITAGCDTAWIWTRVSVVTPLALRCSALGRCATREAYLKSPFDQIRKMEMASGWLAESSVSSITHASVKNKNTAFPDVPLRLKPCSEFTTFIFQWLDICHQDTRRRRPCSTSFLLSFEIPLFFLFFIAGAAFSHPCQQQQVSLLCREQRSECIIPDQGGWQISV